VAALPTDLRGKLLVQCYPPDAWPVAQFGLPAGVSLRAPSPGRTGPQLGAVGVAEYTAGVTKLDDLLGVEGGPVARPRPPAPPVVPTPPNPPTPTPSPAPPSVPPWVWLLGGGLLVWLLTRRT
jgi:hypothetical protein